MKEHYEVLGLAEGAGEQEIKRAYFRLVRQHSPEKDPEGFRRIREAYEALQHPDDGEEKLHVSFDAVDDRFANQMWRQILEAERVENYTLARDTAEEAMRYFPTDERFPYCASRCNRFCGNAGKAVKAAKKLVKLNPDNGPFQRELAMACYDRGYFREGRSAFERAKELGIRDNMFLMCYAQNCAANGKYETGLQTLLELLHRPLSKPTDESFAARLDLWVNLQNFAAWYREISFPYEEVYADIRGLIEQYPRFAGSHVAELAEAVSMIGSTHEGGVSELERSLFDALRGLCSTDRERQAVELYTGHLLDAHDPEDDPRFDEDFTEWLFMDTQGGMLLNAQLAKYLRINMFLIQLEDPESALRKFEILEREYPSYYERVRQFAEELRSAEDIDALRAAYLEKHDRMLRNYESSYYYEKFPERAKERHDGARVISAAGDNTPYVRETKKIGRNDPCPCGSGKKYKNCCLKKGA